MVEVVGVAQQYPLDVPVGGVGDVDDGAHAACEDALALEGVDDLLLQGCEGRALPADEGMCCG